MTVRFVTRRVQALTEGQAAPDVVSALEDLVHLYEAWGEPEKTADYRALLREAAEAEASD